MLARLVAAGLAVTAAAGCAGGGEPTTAVDDPTATETTWSDPSAPAGTPDPDALSGFACGSDRTGTWSATGTLTNRDRTRVGYVVTVLVAGDDAATAHARRERISGLGAGESVQLRLARLPAPAPSDDLTCQVQVVRR